MTNRIYKLDVAKAILMAFVVGVHAFYTYWQFPYANSQMRVRCLFLAFAMPCFAIISGYFMPNKISWKKAGELLSRSLLLRFCLHGGQGLESAINCLDKV